MEQWGIGFISRVVERAGSRAVEAILATVDRGAIRRLHSLWYAVQRRLGGSDTGKQGIYVILQVNMAAGKATAVSDRAATETYPPRQRLLQMIRILMREDARSTG
jgi:hypothetical protein